jgi:hypothetical protein
MQNFLSLVFVLLITNSSFSIAEEKIEKYQLLFRCAGMADSAGDGEFALIFTNAGNYLYTTNLIPDEKAQDGDVYNAYLKQHLEHTSWGRGFISGAVAITSLEKQLEQKKLVYEAVCGELKNNADFLAKNWKR